VSRLSSLLAFFDTCSWLLLPPTQDNAPGHTAGLIQNHMYGIPQATKWPPHSPDFSPIEDVWQAMKAHVRAVAAHINTADDLKAALLWSWKDNTTPAKLNQLYARVWRRMQVAKAMAGGNEYPSKVKRH
jgi:hypothetical protein